MRVARSWSLPAATVLGLLVSLAGGTSARADDPAPDSRAARLIRRGDEAFERSRNPREAWGAEGLYREALASSPDSYEVHWRLARVYSWIAEMEQDTGGNPAVGRKGYDAAFRAIQLNPKRVEGYYWSALCVGEWGKGLGILHAINEGISQKFQRYLDLAMKVDASYEDGGADRVLGFYYRIIPWPLRDYDRSIEHFKKSLEYSPRHPRTLLYYAETLLAVDRRAEAIQELLVCNSIGNREGSPRVNRHYLWRCRKLFKESTR
jgi:tetratricopeptide (TPR) repeat protein